MYVPEGEVGFKVYWEDMSGQKQHLFTSGVEQLGKKGWEKVDIKRITCTGRV